MEGDSGACAHWASSCGQLERTEGAHAEVNDNFTIVFVILWYTFDIGYQYCRES